ncbi:MAG: acetate CoA-transferase subunit alpha [Sporomusaceae bacterium]|nr:acetate CoA-transferase subunit alpha [Sporomusaceae bacterium]
MIDKLAAWDEIGGLFRSGMTIMVGGFLGVGTPEQLVGIMLRQGITGITLIANDTAFPDKGVGQLVRERRGKTAIVSHIGTNPETGRQMLANEMEVLLVPQGTLAERIRCGGAGLGGVLTPTGIGTIAAAGKRVLTVQGREYLLEEPLRADLALIKAKKADKAGNLLFDKAARNFNPLMAMAADLVIAEADEVVEAGTIDPDAVMTPGILIDKIVWAGEGILI